MNRMKIQEATGKTLVWWHNRKNKVDWNPPYQRKGKLWSDTDKAYLIDSILNGFDIPKLYMADFTWGDSKLNVNKLPYAIIDGKQRFEAIFDFFDGKIVLNNDFVLLSNPTLKLGGLSYKDLRNSHKELADEFDTYNLMVMSVYATNEEQINELFIRLNRSKPLTGAEIRNAMSGPAPKIIREICKHEFFNNNIRFPTLRGNDLNLAAKILMFEYNNDFGDTTKSKLDKFVKSIALKEHNKLELSARKIIDTLTDMSEIFLPKDKLLNSAGIVPVYYWFVKNSKEGVYPYIRKFLYEFESKRIENKGLVNKNSKNADINLLFVEFDNYNRNTNNEESHRKRYKIISENHIVWLKTGRFIKK